MNPTALRSLVLEEPPYVLRPDEAIATGRRLRRRRRALATGGLAAVGSVGLAGTLLLSGPGSPPPSDRVLADAPTQAAPQGAIERAVRASTPSGWTFSNAEVLDPSGFQADVDDGAGAGRLHVGTSPSPGSMQQHPCGDSEFALDARCTETAFDGGRLVVRDVARSGQVRTLVVVIVHPDGSGVYVESDNAVWPAMDLAPGTRVTPEQKRALSTPTVTRADPPYSSRQLVELAKAVDATR